jgi:hypothetical protein
LKGVCWIQKTIAKIQEPFAKPNKTWRNYLGPIA